MKSECIIIGGGAAGLAAACVLTQNGFHPIVLEGLDRVGKKLLATGNGRCNLSNVHLSPSCYGLGSDFVKGVYQKTPPEEVYAFFEGLGLLMTTEEDRIYPRSFLATSVLDVLRACCNQEMIHTGIKVSSIIPAHNGGYSVVCDNGQEYHSPYVLICAGGCSSPSLGSDGSGFSILRKLGHSITPVYPGLVQLKCDCASLKSLKGIRTNACLSLYIEGEYVANETGELLFTDYGLSGVCVLQLSRLASPAVAKGQRVTIFVNLLPECEDILSLLYQRISLPMASNALSLFTGIFPRMLSCAVLRQANIAQNCSADQINHHDLCKLADAIGSFPFHVIGTKGFAQAQITCGGVSTGEIIPQTMASRYHEGVYLAGEIIDIDGPCGGYNLHFAFASGITAAKSIIAHLKVNEYVKR